MSKLNIDGVESRLHEMYKVAEEPSTWINKAGPGTKGAEGKDPKAAKFTRDGKYKPQEPGKPGGGKTHKFEKPKDNYPVDNPVPTFTKDTKYASSHKTGTKDEKVPVMKAGGELEGDSGKEYGKHLPRYYQKITTLQTNELLNGFLQGMGPKAPSFVTLKGKNANGASEKDWKIKEGVEGAKLYSPAAPVTKFVTEGVFDGTVILNLGASKKLVFEGASIPALQKFIKNLVEIRQKVHIDVIGGFRPSYDDPKIYESLLTAAHARRCGLENIAKERMQEGYNRFKSMLNKEYNDFLYESKAVWVEKSVKPAFKQAVRAFNAMYESMCKPYMVSVRASTSQGDELFQVQTRSISENYAAAHAIDQIMEATGPKTNVKTINVDAKKYSPEKVKAAGIMMPKFIADGDVFTDMNAAGPGSKATTGPDIKAPTAEVYKGGKGKLPKGAEEHKVSSKEGPYKGKLA